MHRQGIAERERRVAFFPHLQVRAQLLAIVFATALRDAIDQLLDGERTGRWDWYTLRKTEKTHMGTIVEILPPFCVDGQLKIEM